ncbi:hypothetical protein CVD28_04345 [Bacillus sp. M6-12]|uniref:hypothetical protein n=1 Tax=Bacillus sp. M6-12 TaxID=2054166 RepID=UPI000C771D77|nr:hypothetical protein [Bacillus sp. M6-12]PLS19652.1 hypothetical protein CVD28_04345 [Bacillus sp. M6-12]
MKIIDGQKHFTAKEVGMLVERTHLTVHLWDTWSNELAERGDKRLIPEPIKIGKQKTRYWNEKDIPAIEHFAKNIHRGDLAEFSKRQWSKKSNESSNKRGDISEKKRLKSIDAKKELSLEDKLIYTFIYLLDKEGKEISELTIEDCFAFEREKINKSLQALMDMSLVIKTDNKYVVM